MNLRLTLSIDQFLLCSHLSVYYSPIVANKLIKKSIFPILLVVLSRSYNDLEIDRLFEVDHMVAEPNPKKGFT